jgi:hypothetical protein
MHTEVPRPRELLGGDSQVDRLQQASEADRVCDCGEGDQWPNERKPIFSWTRIVRDEFGCLASKLKLE